jgi:acyl carrier protein
MTDHDRIADFIRTRFRNAVRTELKPDDPLFSSGIVDSFGVLELIAFLEDTFQIVIDPVQHELTEFDSINRIAGMVDRSRTRRA